jgi:hypothetical protein
MCYSALVKQDLKHLDRRYGALAVREQIENYLDASGQDPKTYPPLKERIWQNKILHRVEPTVTALIYINENTMPSDKHVDK